MLLESRRKQLICPHCSEPIGYLNRLDNGEGAKSCPKCAGPVSFSLQAIPFLVYGFSVFAVGYAMNNHVLSEPISPILIVGVAATVALAKGLCYEKDIPG